MSIAIKRNFIIPSTSAIGASELYLTSNAVSTNTISGALRVVGGVGIGGSLSLGYPLTVPSGGTGITSYTTGDILYASSSTLLGKITAGSAGSILTSRGAGSAPYWALPAPGGVISLIGTANQVLVNGGSGVATSGDITLSTPQSIGTASSPSFFDVTLTSGNNSTLTSVGSSPESIVNKQYVDNLASGLDIHGSVRAIQTSSVGASYIQTQTSGFAATGSYLISTTKVSLPTFDGVTISATGITQRILINGGFTGTATIGGTAPFTPINSNIANGIYYVGALGGAGTSNWILVRATDTDDNTELTGGTFTFIEEGTTYADSGWVCSNDTTNFGPIQFGSTAITFTQFTGGGTFSVGQGLNKVGSYIASNINISSVGVASGIGYTQFNLGGITGGGVADTGYYPTFGVRTSGTVAGSSMLTLNSDGFSLSGSTNLDRSITVTGSDITLIGGGNTLTLTGSVSFPAPTNNGIAYGSSSTAVSFLTASGSGTSVLTQISGSAPRYLSQSQLSVGAATSSALVNVDASTGTRYLLGTVLNTASGSTQVSVGSGITIGNNLLTSGGIALTNTTASTSTSSGALTVAGGAGIGGSVYIGGSLNISGNLSVVQSTEQYLNYTSSIGSGATVNLAANTNGGIIYVNTGTVSGNWTLNITGLALTNSYAASITTIVGQGATAYIPSTLRISGTAQNINWQGGSAPSGNANKKDVIIFSILSTGAGTTDYLVLGQLVSFG